MLDKLTAAVLGVVNEETGGSYKVMDAGDFMAVLQGERADEAGLDGALRYLDERGYIDIRYAESGTYCLCSLPKGRTYAETVAAEQGEKRAKSTFWALFFGAFSGGLAGALIAGLLCAFLL